MMRHNLAQQAANQSGLKSLEQDQPSLVKWLLLCKPVKSYFLFCLNEKFVFHTEIAKTALCHLMRCSLFLSCKQKGFLFFSPHETLNKFRIKAIMFLKSPP